VDQLGDALEQRIAVGSNLRAVRREVDAIVEHDLVAHDSHLFLVWAAVVVRVTVFGLGLVGAEIGWIEDPVFVVVGIRAAVLVLETIPIFWIIRALVAAVRDSIAIVVRIRATVGVFEPVAVLGDERTFVDRIFDAVFVGVVVG